MKHPLIDGVVFDLWQTLLYSPSPPWLDEGLKKGFGTGWQPFVDYVLDTAQRRSYPTIGDYLADVLPKGGCDPAGELAGRFRAATERELAATTTYPDALPALAEVRRRGYRTALLSNITSPHCAPIDRLGLRQYFDRTLLSCEHGLIKPEPEFFQRACAELQLPPERCLMVGDSIALDVTGARSAGLWAVWLNRPEHKLVPREIPEPPLPPGVPRIEGLDRLIAGL